MIRLAVGLFSAVPAVLAVFVGVVAALIGRTFYGSESGSAIGWTAAFRQVDWLPVLLLAGLLSGVCSVTFRSSRGLYLPSVLGLAIGASVDTLHAPWAGEMPAVGYEAFGRVESFWGEWLVYGAALHVVVALALAPPLRRLFRPFRH